MPSKDFYQAGRAKAYYHANKEEIAAKTKAYYRANKEEIAAKAYRQAKKERMAAGGKPSARRPRGSS